MQLLVTRTRVERVSSAMHWGGLGSIRTLCVLLGSQGSPIPAAVRPGSGGGGAATARLVPADTTIAAVTSQMSRAGRVRRNARIIDASPVRGLRTSKVERVGPGNVPRRYACGHGGSRVMTE